jgi:hypothetical protein
VSKSNLVVASDVEIPVVVKAIVVLAEVAVLLSIGEILVFV